MNKLIQTFSSLNDVACQWIEEIIDSITDSVIVLDKNYQIVAANHVTLGLLGYSENEIYSLSIANIISNPVNPIMLVEKSIESAIEVTYLTAQDQSVTVLLSSTIIQPKNELHQGIICIAKNITQSKSLEQLIKEGEERLNYDVRHDKLTGLPNRLFFIEELEKFLARKNNEANFNFAVLILDLDQFKLINNSYGHLVGDTLLSQISERVQPYLRTEDVIARLGGDEFGIILSGVSTLRQVSNIIELIKNEFNRPFSLNRYEVFISGSIGLTWSELNYQQVEDILRDADAALHQAKNRSKANYAVFRPKMRTDAINRLQLDNDLRRAIDRNEFQLHYQPIIELDTEKIVGVEALIRWNSLRKGFISPAQFIPIAEENGLIIPISQWVLETACQQMYQWHKTYPELSHLMLSVNLSGKQFFQVDLVDQIMSTINNIGINNNCLKLEVTESSIIQNTEMAIDILTQLKTQGIKLSMDDFGTGYSSLSYLHHFPFDTLKIDCSFIQDIYENNDKLSLTQTIMTLANNFGMEVIAEGIETIEQVQKLQDLRCPYGQGYYFARPLSGEDSEKLLLKSYKIVLD